MKYIILFQQILIVNLHSSLQKPVKSTNVCCVSPYVLELCWSGAPKSLSDPFQAPWKVSLFCCKFSQQTHQIFHLGSKSDLHWHTSGNQTGQLKHSVFNKRCNPLVQARTNTYTSTAKKYQLHRTSIWIMICDSVFCFIILWLCINCIGSAGFWFHMSCEK